MAYATSTRRLTGRTPGAPARKMGTWKMAYADFLTALMAFFLVMWITSGTSQSEREELASYFSGQMTSETTSYNYGSADQTLAQMQAQLLNTPEFQQYARNIRLIEEANALRIELVDDDLSPLFETGQAKLNTTGRMLAGIVGKILSSQTVEITIEGHTDAFASADQNYTNWELSSERANEARRLLVKSGISTDRFRAVSGRADTEPLNAGQPHLSANRRISILAHIAH